VANLFVYGLGASGVWTGAEIVETEREERAIVLVKGFWTNSSL